ncbi:potassium-transporting ATPase subunit KdpC [Aureimonas pseudogalii]|uniref:Potassium-transporting ATPase KdpC subunit n=1 Tax=Aureimonas pseudogalii TaxID=1744844 RepID=A0A7W6E907_9HYPH|nr:potassium-transporting ATPase subunit KdpC [Aureimonas pseudogalii]MBB3996981.1 K+-transporting ATPase ATPase C chain [Aureimonas pseudogalii]
MLAQLRAAATLLGVLTVLLGLLYPLAMTAVAGALFPEEAKGSLVMRDGVAVGSRLVGQSFADARYLHPRPSVAGAGYDASASSGSNLGPTSATLAERLATDAAVLRARTGAALLPADAVTTSGSGLDPEISPAFADLQAAGIAEARGLPVDTVRRVLAAATTGRTLGFLGEPRVNVLAANLALDAAAPVPADGVPTASASPAG